MKAVLSIVTAALVLAFAGVTAGSAASPAIVAKPIAVGTMKATTIRAGSGSAILDAITIQPGGNFGWHVHGSPVAVVVTGGTLTVFDPSVANCKPFSVSKGQSFVEPAGHIHLARNDGTRAVTLYAFYLGLPKKEAPNTAEAAPASCDS